MDSFAEWYNNTDVRTKVQQRQTIMDADLSLFLLVPHVMKGIAGNFKDEPLDDVANVTSSQPNAYLQHLMSILGSFDIQLDIKAKDEAISKLLVRWWDILYYNANERYGADEGYTINGSMVAYAALQGCNGLLAMMCRPEDGEEYAKILPLNMRGVAYQRKTDGKGLKRIGIPEERTVEELKEKYPGADIKGNSQDKKKCVSAWAIEGGKCKELFYVGDENSIGDRIKINPTGIGIDEQTSIVRSWVKEIPISVKPVAVIPTMAHTDTTLTNKSEMMSAYHALRDVYNDIDDLQTIQKTLAVESLTSLITHNADAGRELDKTPKAGVVEMRKDEELDRLPPKDINTAALNLEQIKRDERNTTSINEVNRGVTTGDISAVALAGLTKATEMVMNPFKYTMQNTYKDAFGFLFRQYIDGRFDMKKATGMYADNPVSWNELLAVQNKFTIAVNLVPSDPEQDAATLRLAEQMVQAGDPIDWVNKNVRKIKDYDKYLEARNAQLLEKYMPAKLLVAGLNSVNEKLKKAKKKTPEYNALFLEAKLYEQAINRVLQEQSSQPEQQPVQGQQPVMQQEQGSVVGGENA